MRAISLVRPDGVKHAAWPAAHMLCLRPFERRSTGGEASTAYLARQQLLNDPNMAALQASATADACQTPTGLAGAPSLSAGPVRGRAGYPRVRTLRTKPGRPDSPAAYSLSCSDKIARYGALGLQGALLSDMLEPIWLTGIVLGPVVADEDCLALEAEVTEALSGRVVREYEDERIRGEWRVITLLSVDACKCRR